MKNHNMSVVWQKSVLQLTNKTLRNVVLLNGSPFSFDIKTGKKIDGY
jgi:hypothetical protein